MLLPSGYFSTSGNQVVDANGDPVRIASVGLHDHSTSTDIATMESIVAARFNTIRVSWDDATLPSDLTYIQQLSSVAAQAGLKIIIDHHFDATPSSANGFGAQQANGLWYDSGPGSNGSDGFGNTLGGTVTQAIFLNDWTKVAATYPSSSTATADPPAPDRKGPGRCATTW
ncbi:MAG TPA: hypothetical protein DDZ81_19210 [Acetobacteraceae bacterium]|jgi:endoglucanase|nr:hypothetical protein [Acetobacteraceae bacterium]